jgi:hypothetical protein
MSTAKRAAFIGFMFGLVVLVASLMPITAYAWTVGDSLEHQLSVCLKKEDAVEIVTAHRDKGLVAAQEVWEAKDACRTIPVIGATVGKVVFSAPVEVNGEKRTGSVVEIVRGGEVIGFFLTTQPVENKGA